MSVGFFLVVALRGRAEPKGTGIAGTPALVRLLAVLCSAPPPHPQPASAPARLCGAAVGGRGERDHLRPESLRWEGERLERGEGPARCLLLRATAAGAPTSSRAAPSAAKGYCRTTSLLHPPLRPGLCGRRQHSLAACGPFWVWVWVLLGPTGKRVAVTRCPSLQRAQLWCAGPCPHISLWGHWKAELRPAPYA